MTEKRAGTAIIGLGRWGANIARELCATHHLSGYVISGSEESLKRAKNLLPSVTRMSLEDVCADPTITTVFLATPIHTHATLATRLITAEKNVCVEKPIAETSAEAEALVALANKHGRLLMTGYVFLYGAAYEKLRTLLETDPAHTITVTWKKYGTFEESIEQNLLTHHLAYAVDLLGTPDSGTLVRHTGQQSACDATETTLVYPGCTFFSSINRLSEKKSHTLTVKTHSNKIYTLENDTLSDATGRELFRASESPLARELQKFLAAIEEGEARPRTEGNFGAKVLKVYEQLQS